MRAGKLRYRVEFLERREVDDGEGGTTVTGPVVVGTMQMGLETLSGRALLTAQQIDPRARHRGVGRWSPTFTPSPRQRARVRGQVWDVVHVADVGFRRREVEVLFAEGGA